MKPGDVVEWMDQGPAILLEEVDVPEPCTEEELGDFLADPESWPTERGWKIKLLLTQEIVDVHIETLNSNFAFTPEGIH
jgi:hypothetical protein